MAHSQGGGGGGGGGREREERRKEKRKEKKKFQTSTPYIPIAGQEKSRNETEDFLVPEQA